MKKIVFPLLATMLCILFLYASPEPNTAISLDSLMESYTATSDSVIQRMNVITAKVDSLHAQMKSDAEKDWLWWDIDASNVWIAFVGLIIAAIALGFGIAGTIYGARGYKASRDTANNVLRASFNVQRGQFDDLIRHLYRNLVCTLAFTQRVVENRNPKQVEDRKPFRNNSGSKRQKQGQAVSRKTKGQLQKQKDKHFSAYRQAGKQDKETLQPESKEAKPQKYQYPSEEHLMKLKVLPEDVLHLESYNHDYTIYQKMHNLKLLLRNYDMEIDTAMTYLKDGTQGNAVIMGKLDALTFKPLYLIFKIIEVVETLDEKESKKKDSQLADKNRDEYQNAASIMTCSHVKNLIENKDKFKKHEYLDLNRQLPLEQTGKADENENTVKKPYNGLTRAYNQFFGKMIDANGKKDKHDKGNADRNGEDRQPAKDFFVEYDKRFDDNGNKYIDYTSVIKRICEKNKVRSNDSEEVRKLKAFRKSIIAKKDDTKTDGNFPFKEHFLTMLSIDVTIELSKILMIDINKPA